MSTLPSHIARYSVVEPIAAGGMGEVFLARDDRLDRLVAIKLLRDGFDSDDLRSRFEEEARNVAKLTHPNIVTIYEYGAHEGRPYIAMEYVAGYSMADLVRRRMPLSLARRVRLIEELCAGLGHAHKAQLVHRDIKPANLMVSTSGMLKVLDFGIAKLRGTDRTQKGLLVGTVNYMSPEQITGQPVDHRSDIFAVGLVLHEVLTYDQAFKGDLTTAMFAIVHGQPEPLAARCPGLDPGFQLIVSRCLAKSPADRYQDLSVLKRDLGRLRRPLEDDEGELADTIGPFVDERTVLANNDAAIAPTEVKAAGPDTRRARESAVAAGEAAIARGQFESALRHAEQALALESDNAAARDLLDRARRALEGAKLDSQIGRVRAALADDRLDEARSGLAAAVALAPDTTRTRDLALQIERREAEIREAAAAAARAAEAQRAAEAEAVRLAEAQRAAEAEAARQAEAARVARERERAEAERARLAREAAAAEAARRAEERRAAEAEAEAARIAEQQRAADAEAARQAEATRLARERERAGAERERLAREAEAEAARLAEARRAADAEAARLAAEARAAEAETARRAEDERRAAEAERVARERREADAQQRADADRDAPTQYWEAPTIVAAPPATRASAAPAAGPATNDTAIVDAPRWPVSRTPEPEAAPAPASTSSSPSRSRIPLVVGGIAATLLLAVWLWPRGPVAETSPAPAPSPATPASGASDAPAPPPADLGAAPLSNPGALSEFRTGPEAQPGRREADAPAPAPAPAAPATSTGTNARPADSGVPARPSPATPSTSGSASTTRPATPSATGASTPATNTSGPVVAPPATTTTSSPAAPTTRPATGTSTASGATGSSVSPAPAGPRPTPPSATTAPAEPVAPPRAEPAGGTTTTAPAPAPPPPPASDGGAAARQLDEATIRRLVNAFGQAYASKDLKALRAVWPTMSGGDESSYRNVFNSYRTISWATGDTNIRFEGERADVRSSVQVTQRALRPDTTTTQTRTYRFRMERRGSSWVLVGVENLGAAR